MTYALKITYADGTVKTFMELTEDEMQGMVDDLREHDPFAEVDIRHQDEDGAWNQYGIES